MTTNKLDSYNLKSNHAVTVPLNAPSARLFSKKQRINSSCYLTISVNRSTSKGCLLLIARLANVFTSIHRTHAAVKNKCTFVHGKQNTPSMYNWSVVHNWLWVMRFGVILSESSVWDIVLFMVSVVSTNGNTILCPYAWEITNKQKMDMLRSIYGRGAGLRQTLSLHRGEIVSRTCRTNFYTSEVFLSSR